MTKRCWPTYHCCLWFSPRKSHLACEPFAEQNRGAWVLDPYCALWPPLHERRASRRLLSEGSVSDSGGFAQDFLRLFSSRTVPARSPRTRFFLFPWAPRYSSALSIGPRKRANFFAG